MSDSTTTTTPEHDAKAMLQEALDTIKATYWIQNTEFTWAEASQVGWEDDGFTVKWDWTPWEEIEKAIEVPVSDALDQGSESRQQREGKGKVTGVCSIGALTLAETTLYDIPLEPYENRASWDFPLWLTGVSLAKAIWSIEGADFYGEHGGAEWASVIATWNDRPVTERDDVINSFTKALEDPLLTMPKGQVPVEITYDTTWGTTRTGWVFATRAEAEAWLVSEEGQEYLTNRFASGHTYEIKDVRHDALAVA